MDDPPKKHVFERYLRNAIGKTAVHLSKNKRIAQTPALSLVSIISSLRVLAVRGSRFIEFSSVPGDFFSWQKPSLTFTGLIFYTIICIRPQLIALVPILTILGGTFIPQYARKYMIPEQTYMETMRKVELEDIVKKELEQQDPGERDLINMLRSVQASLSNLVGLFEWIDHARDTFGDFRNPHESSALFIVFIGLLIAAYTISSYLPLKPMFVIGGWVFVTLMHPGVRAMVQEFASEVEEIEEKIRESTFFPVVYKLLQDQFQFNDVEIIRESEVFELEKQGLTSRFWEPVGFVSTITPSSGSFGQRFHRVAKDIDDIQPPEKWFFNEGEQWNLDSNTHIWLDQRQIDDLKVVNGWVHSKKGSYRARRHYRKCFYKP